MPSTVLGVTAFFHDSSAALVVDGQLVAAAEEERFTRQKHDASFPQNSVAYCLHQAKLNVQDLSLIVFFEQPRIKLSRILATHICTAPRGFTAYLQSVPSWVSKRVKLEQEFSKLLGKSTRPPIAFCEHHLSHAASAFYPSPFEQAAIVTVDGVGEWSTTTIGIGRGNDIRILKELRFPHSLGLLYSAFTQFLGFEVNSGEYKVMGLAPYGSPIYADRILREMLHLQSDGSFALDMSYFEYHVGFRMASSKLAQLVGRPPRHPNDLIRQPDMDLAASIQAVADCILRRIVKHAACLTQTDSLCLAGGVALNCVSNAAIRDSNSFKRIWVQPAAGDAGTSLGAALWGWHHVFGRHRKPVRTDAMSGSLLGPEFSDIEIRTCLSSMAVKYRTCDDDNDLIKSVALQIASGKVVGWFSGRMEFGPRALGCRSILADPRFPKMKAILNERVKYREMFRPFAPCVLLEEAPKYFEMGSDAESPYMLFTVAVRSANRRTDSFAAASHPMRPSLPAVTHVDSTARVQTVSRDRNERLYRLLREFYSLTGCPALINTSFNIRGEPIVCSPRDAILCFLASGIDTLAIGNCIVDRGEQAVTLFDIGTQHAYKYGHD